MSSNLGPLFQNSLWVGVTFQNVMYGMVLILYFKTMHVMLFHKRAEHSRINLFYAIFSTVMLLLSTIAMATQALFCEQMWLQHANYPGGPAAYWAANISEWWMDVSMVASVLLQLMTDALMIYRCRVICESYRVVVVPLILWVSTLVLGTLVCWSTSVPGGDFFANLGAKLGLAYYSIAVGQTAILTALICHRMVTRGRMARKYLGEDYAALYFALLTVIVESVLPYTMTGIAFVVSLGLNSGTSVGFSCVYIMMMCLSPQLVIYRMASGGAWKDGTSKVLPSTVRFSYGPGHPGSTWTGSSAAEEGSTILPGVVKLETIEERCKE